MSKARPIDANALKKKAKLYSLGYWDDDEWAVPLCEISEAPTLDTYGTWIPCEERLPKLTEYVLVTIWDDYLEIGYFDKDEKGTLRFVAQEFEYYGEDVKYIDAWMPLPKPYEAKENKQ